MKKRNQVPSPDDSRAPDLRTDVEGLLEKTVVEEAVTDVWGHFEKALSTLDNDSIELLQQHFRGRSAVELGRSRGLTVDQVEAWLSRIKRELVVALRGDFTVRQ